MKKVTTLVKNCHHPHPPRGVLLVGTPRWRIGDNDIAANILDVEWDEATGRGRRRKRPSREAHGRKRAVKHIDTAGGARVIRGIEHRLRLVDRQSGIDG